MKRASKEKVSIKGRCSDLYNTTPKLHLYDLITLNRTEEKKEREKETEEKTEVLFGVKNAVNK
jgi:hypothetical protein